MMRKIVVSETAKNIIIILLVISALFLAVKAFTYSAQGPIEVITSLFSGTRQEVGSAPDAGSETLEPPRPVYIMLTSQGGAHFAAKYNNQVKEELFTQYSAILGEALGSASKPTKLSEEQWQATLKYSNVYFDFVNPLPLSYLASRLGTTVTANLNDTEASRLCIACNGDSLNFVFINANTGSIYSYNTALGSDILYGGLAQHTMDNSHFAFELGDSYAYLDSCFIFSDEEFSLKSVSMRSPAVSEVSTQTMLPAFGMSDRASQDYAESDGSIVYVDGSKSLRIQSDGSILFSAAGSEGALSEALDKNDAKNIYIEHAESLVTTALGEYSGSASLRLISSEFSTNPSTAVICFDYSLDGVPVFLGTERCAARVKYSGGKIVRVELIVREYSFTGAVESPLPETQAVALAGSSGGFPVLIYDDSEAVGGYKWRQY